MATALTPLANLTLGSAQVGVTFSNIPGTYRDLILKVNGSVNTAATYLGIQFNGDTGANYSWNSAENSSTSAAGFSTGTNNTQIWTAYQFQNWNTTSRSSLVAHFLDYAATDKHKVALVEGGGGSVSISMASGRWASLSAITSIKIVSVSGYQFASGTSFALYGVLA